MQKEIFKVEKIGNVIFITDVVDQVWKCWNVESFTERKLNNAMKKIQSGYKYEVEFIRTF